MKKLLILLLIFATAQIHAIATKLQNGGKRIDVQRFDLVCLILQKLEAEHSQLLWEFYALIKNTRRKTKCFISQELAEKLQSIIKEITGNEFALWDEKNIVYPDVRHMVKAACMANEAGAIDIRRPQTKS